MIEYHIEFWRSGRCARCERISIRAACWFHAQQICIGRYAPAFMRQIPRDAPQYYMRMEKRPF